MTDVDDVIADLDERRERVRETMWREQRAVPRFHDLTEDGSGWLTLDLDQFDELSDREWALYRAGRVEAYNEAIHRLTVGLYNE